MSESHQGRRIAVVGSGVAGLTAAYVASKSARVTLFEADGRLGGHADTHDVLTADGRRLAIDTGFIVHNERTYPTLLRMFAELGIVTQESEMSMSVSDAETGLEYAGALGARGVIPRAGHLADPSYLRMLTEIPRFHRRAKELLAADPATRVSNPDVTLREFLAAGRFTPYFERHFAEPLVAAVWSCDPAIALDYPARYLFEFLNHHHMLAVFGSPVWRTVTGGSREYVDRIAASLADVRTGTKVTSVLETSDGVRLTDGNGHVTTYDAVVIATHPDQALAMLAEATASQRDVLGAMPYSTNTALLHTDTSLMPADRRVWASWNFRRPPDDQPGGPLGERASGADAVTVTYDLTRLMRLPTKTHYLVTLGGEHLVDPGAVIGRREYAHPIYHPASVAAQRRLPECDTDRVAFAGAYHGWGFHEDGARSGTAAAERLGLAWPATTAGSAIPAPRIYASTIRHTRRAPWRRTFTHRAHTWLVDLDDLPDHGMLGRFEARDHLGDPSRSIRANVDAYLARHGIELGTGRVLMAANARAFGYCFNPISVHWCFDDTDRLAAVVVEVHNTYGDREAYLVHPDPQGRATTAKRMYVSPFHGVDGSYDLAVPIPGRRLDIAVTLTTDDGEVFSAGLTGRDPASPTAREVRRAAPAAARGSALIRAHGILLWARRLPVRARPAHPRQDGV
ncbi:MAG: FAD-dependent oxidoreductase [Nocardioides sp.]